MNYDYPQSALSKSVLAGVFAGLASTLVNLAYDYFYRSFSEFSPSEIINVSSIIFVTMLLFTVAGFVHYWLTSSVKQGNALYIIIFAVVAVVCSYGSLHVTRSNNAVDSEHFRILLLGIVAPTTLLVAFFVPYLIKHDTLYS